MIKIIRYSLCGFQPQKQTECLKDIDYHLNKFNIEDFPEHLRYSIQNIHERNVKFYIKHLNDLQEGVWFFLDSYKNNQSLNHLKRKVPCWEAEIEEDVYVYDCNWDKIVSITDSIVKFGGCYIPKSQMYKIHNIKKRKH